MASSGFYPILDSLVAAGLNTVIFDLKNMKGDVFFSGVQKDSLLNAKHKPIFSIESVIKELHARNLKAVARMVMFHDTYLAEKMEEARPESRTSGKAWTENKRRGPAWLDPSDIFVQRNLLDLIKIACSSGIDELQLDYIRFPTQGNLADAVFDFEKEDAIQLEADSTYTERTKTDIIEDFVFEVRQICSEWKVTLTADIFAIVAWQREQDVRNTGQDITRLSPHLDAIHPMIYSSHFDKNFSYREDTHNEPYYIVYQAARLTGEKADSLCRVIPYIQANGWQVNYGREYVWAQLKAVEDSGSNGFIIWNSSNKYFKTLNWIKDYYHR
ncbi:MAG: hypothetical protein JW784_02605 [Candidatus Cloacimonetes bacterium]|nr:hypothetical protein [Candidatus Cloacimonadota bacterium]